MADALPVDQVTDTANQTVGQVGDTAGQAVGQATQAVGQVGNSAGEAVGGVGKGAGEAVGGVAQGLKQAGGDDPIKLYVFNAFLLDHSLQKYSHAPHTIHRRLDINLGQFAAFSYQMWAKRLNSPS